MQKNILITLFLLIDISHCAHAMWGKNWVPVPQHGMCNKNCCVIWKGNDSREQVIIRYCPTTGARSGKCIRHNTPLVERPLSNAEVEKYLVELRELNQKG